MGKFGWSIPAGCNNINLPGEEDFDDSIPEELVTEEQRKEIIELYHNVWSFKSKGKPSTIDEMFENAPAGDFKWENDDPGDGFAYECDNSDCPASWHMAYYCDTFGRKNGKRFIEVHSGDEDGNWDFSDGWEEGEDSEEITNLLGERLDNYFSGWAKYWLYCAENAREILEAGEDPLDQVIKLSEIKPEELVEFFLAAAREDIKYLKM